LLLRHSPQEIAKIGTHFNPVGLIAVNCKNVLLIETLADSGVFSNFLYFPSKDRPEPIRD
jgi:hypothetical protein